MKCEMCDKKLPLKSKKVEDPFIREIYGEVKKRWLCDSCVAERCDEI